MRPTITILSYVLVLFLTRKIFLAFGASYTASNLFDTSSVSALCIVKEIARIIT